VSVCAHRDDAAAWVLGALPEPEGTAFGAHLHVCGDCRENVADLGLVADSLPAAAPSMAPPAALRGRIMAIVAAEAELLQAAAAPSGRDASPAERPRLRRRLLSLRPLLAVAMASVLLAVGLGAGALLSADAPPRTLAAEIDRTAAPHARAALHIDDDGTRLMVAGLPQAPSGRVYQVWLKRANQAPDPTDALFTVNADGRGSVAVPGDLEGIVGVLVTDEPLGGSSVPSRRPVISAAL
jgi:hypothetical protein